MRTVNVVLVALGVLLVLVGQAAGAAVAPQQFLAPATGATSEVRLAATVVPETVAPAGIRAVVPDVQAEALTDVVQQYCTGCHNPARLTGNLSLVDFEVERAPEMAETAEKMIQKLRAGMMPP